MITNETIISVENLKKSFGDIEVLNGINTEIKKGEVVVVIGPSGCGKSTFLRCLNLLENPTGGKITFEGTEITDKKTDINLHRQKMGMVFQHFNLFANMNILKNMTIAPTQLLKKSKADESELFSKSWYNARYLQIAKAYPVSGQTVTHYTIRKERGLPDGIPVIDEYAPISHAGRGGAPLVLFSGDRELEMLARYEENLHLQSLLKHFGHDSVLYEMQGFTHGSVVEPAVSLIRSDIKKLWKKYSTSSAR